MIDEPHHPGRRHEDHSRGEAGITFFDVLAEMMRTVTTTSPEETFQLGRELAAPLQTATVFLLEGDLGTGKTIFTKGIAAGLGIDPREVTSPTFTLVAEHQGRLKLYHIDLYRLDDLRDIWDHLGLHELLDEEAVLAIEWAEKVPDLPVRRGYRVRLRWIDETTREITIQSVSQSHRDPSRP